DPDADGRDLVCATHPDARAPFHAPCLQTELREHVYEDRLEAAHVADHVDGFGEPEDRVAHQLARTVPGDLATSVHVDHRCPVGGSLVILRAFARGVDRGVLEEDHGVGGSPGDNG